MCNSNVKAWLLSFKKKYLDGILPRKSSKYNLKPAWLHIMKAPVDMLGVITMGQVLLKSSVKSGHCFLFFFFIFLNDCDHTT